MNDILKVFERQESMSTSSMFSDVLEKRIKERANKNYDMFWKEFESFLYKYHLKREVIFKGLEGAYSKQGDIKSDWRDAVKDIFIQTETEKFISEINRLENYFNQNGKY